MKTPLPRLLVLHTWGLTMKYQQAKSSVMNKLVGCLLSEWDCSCTIPTGFVLTRALLYPPPPSGNSLIFSYITRSYRRIYMLRYFCARTRFVINDACRRGLLLLHWRILQCLSPRCASVPCTTTGYN